MNTLNNVIFESDDHNVNLTGSCSTLNSLVLDGTSSNNSISGICGSAGVQDLEVRTAALGR